MFRVGQKVVCVEDGSHAGGCAATPLILNAVYTIREILLSDLGNPHVRLVEVANPPVHARQGYAEPCYSATRFRPVVETDISIFNEMLNNVPLRDKVRA